MNDELFTQLMDSVHEGGAILRGEKEPTRRFEIAAPDVKQIRERYDLKTGPWGRFFCYNGRQ